VNKLVLRQRAEDGLWHDLEPGERIAAGSAATSDPSRSGAAVLLVVALELIAAGLLSLFGSYRSGKYGASLRCGIPDCKPILLHEGRAGRKDFAEVEKVLARTGAFAKLDPAYPSAEKFSAAAYRH